MNFLLDTNSIIYFLNGQAKELFFKENNNILISFITKIELLVYPSTSNEEKAINTLLEHYKVLFIDDALISKTIAIRKNYGLKLPDSIIIASALQEEATLVTSDKEIAKKGLKIGLKILDPLST